MQDTINNALGFIRHVQVKESDIGMFYASCVEEPAFLVAGRSQDELNSFIAVAFKMLYKERDSLETQARLIHNAHSKVFAWQINTVSDYSNQVSA